MSDEGLRLAIRHIGLTWRVYAIRDTEWGPAAQVMRLPDEKIRKWDSEADARAWIMEQPDAIEVDHPGDS